MSARRQRVTHRTEKGGSVRLPFIMFECLYKSRCREPNCTMRAEQPAPRSVRARSLPSAAGGRAASPDQGGLVLHLRSGRWPPGFELPSEESLCPHYGVSRGTLRRAIADLVADGYIERHAGAARSSRPKLESGVVGTYNRFHVVGPPLDPGGRVLQCRRRASRTSARCCGSRRATGSGSSSGSIYAGRPVEPADQLHPGRDLCPDLSRHDLARVHLIDVLRDEYGVHSAARSNTSSRPSPTATRRAISASRAHAAVPDRARRHVAGDRCRIPPRRLRGDITVTGSSCDEAHDRCRTFDATSFSQAMQAWPTGIRALIDKQ